MWENSREFTNIQGGGGTGFLLRHPGLFEGTKGQVPWEA